MVSVSGVITTIFLILALALIIYTVVYLGSLRTALKNSPDVLGPVLTYGGADFLFWVYIAFMILIILFLIYNIAMLVIGSTPQGKAMSMMR